MTERPMQSRYAYRPVLFFAMAYAATWIPWFLAAYASSQKGLETYAPLLNLLGLLGPCAAALLLIFSSGSTALKSDFKDRLFNLRRIRPAYLLLAVAMPPAVMLGSVWLSVQFGQPADQFQLSGGANLLAMIVLALVLAPMFEELGWRGYGVDSLRAKTGMMQATLLFAALWSVWHAPLVLIGGSYQNELARMENKLFIANFFISIVPAAIIANWLYYKNNRSIPAAIVLHSMLNAAAVLLNAGQIAKCIATLLYSAIAVGVVVLDRALFAQGPQNFVETPPSRRSAG